MPDSLISPAVAEWLAANHHAVLVTLRRDGSPQTSNISTTFDPDTQTFAVSVTDDRAKTRNLRRDPRGTLHILGESFWGYASVGIEAEVGDVTTEPGDAAGQALLALYQSIAGPHPDPAEFFEAMVQERRLVLTARPVSLSGSGLPS